MAEDNFEHLAEEMEHHWLRELQAADKTRGFYQKSTHFGAVFQERSYEQLVISFDNLQEVGSRSITRVPWGYRFFKKHNFSHLGFQSNLGNWFRDLDMIRYFENLSRAGFFRQFQNVALTGTSMGGFAALAFSRLIPGANVMAFSPQTTLDTNIVPWETRFRRGRAQDWTLPYSDASQGLETASKVYILFDPLLHQDRLQIERIKPADNIHLLKLPGGGHKTVVSLRRMEALATVQIEGIKGTMTVEKFRKIARGRREIFIYRQSLEHILREKGRDILAERFVQLFKENRYRNAANNAETEDGDPENDLE